MVSNLSSHVTLLPTLTGSSWRPRRLQEELFLNKKKQRWKGQGRQLKHCKITLAVISLASPCSPCFNHYRCARRNCFRRKNEFRSAVPISGSSLPIYSDVNYNTRSFSGLAPAGQLAKSVTKSVGWPVRRRADGNRITKSKMSSDKICSLNVASFCKFVVFNNLCKVR